MKLFCNFLRGLLCWTISTFGIRALLPFTGSIGNPCCYPALVGQYVLCCCYAQIEGMGQIWPALIDTLQASQWVLAKDLAARRVLDQGQGPSGLLGAWQSMYVHTIDKYPKKCFVVCSTLYFTIVSFLVYHCWTLLTYNWFRNIAQSSQHCKAYVFPRFSGPDLTHIP